MWSEREGIRNGRCKMHFFAAEEANRSRRGRSSSSNLHGSSKPVALRVVGAVLIILNLIKYMALEKNRGLVCTVQPQGLYIGPDGPWCNIFEEIEFSSQRLLIDWV